MTNDSNELFPIFLKPYQLHTVIVGGGHVGLEKLQALLGNSPSAPIKLIAVTIKEEIRALAKTHPSLKLIHRRFQATDLQGVDVAILATENRQTNFAIRLLAKKQNILVNVADTPDLCDFYLGSVVKKGHLKIGISTNGQSPTFAKRLRQVLEEVLPDETHDLIGNLKILRDRLKGDFQNKVVKLNQYTASLVRGEQHENN